MTKWKAYDDIERTADNAYDAEELEYPVPIQLDFIRAIKRGIMLERERCAMLAHDYGIAHKRGSAYRFACEDIENAIRMIGGDAD